MIYQVYHCPPIDGAEGATKNREFDFLINGELIRGSLEAHIANNDILVVSL